MKKRIHIKICWLLILLLAIYLNGCTSLNRKEKDGFEVWREESVKELEAIYPGRTFEMYAVEKHYEAIYPTYYTVYYRCLEDGVLFDRELSLQKFPDGEYGITIDPEGMQRLAKEYLREKRNEDGRKEVEAYLSGLSSEWDYISFNGHIGTSDIALEDLEKVDLNIFYVLDQYFKENYTVVLRIQCYREYSENIDWENEAEAMWQVYQKYILPYDTLEEYNYILSFNYLPSGVMGNNNKYNGKPYWDGRSAKKTVSLSRYFSNEEKIIYSYEDIYKMFMED